jgi:alpha-beta hydrolase superfamily lysophospholipase
MSHHLPLLLSTTLLLAGCQTPATVSPPREPSLAPAAAEAAPQPTDCPADVPSDARCLAGQDSAGAFYLVAIPRDWNGVLVLHAHGGPALGAPTAKRVADDLTRWAITVKAGYAWAGSSFAQGGVAVRAAATDTERLRRIVVQHVAQPRRTVLHGQSWGASVAAKGAELFTAGKPYDAVLLSSGVLGGGTRSYDFRLDLRVLYQQLCHNHPRPDEAAYPLWQGLPADATMKQADLAKRSQACLGLGLPAAQRTPEQAAKLKTLLDVLKLPESSLQGHLNWATFHFRDIAQHRTGGRNVFGNLGANYQGSADDAALNAAVQRYAADPQAVARFGADTDPNGHIPVPVLTVHAIEDPTAFVELEHQFQRTMQAAGTADHLVQTFADFDTHSYLSDPVYPALLEALLRWVDAGEKPTPRAIAQRCDSLESRYGAACRFLPDYRPASLDTRITPRQRP